MKIALCILWMLVSVTLQPANEPTAKSHVPPFTLHIIDDQSGHGIVLDVDGSLIIIDGGGSNHPVYDYLKQTGLDGRPVGLIIIRDAYFQSWGGLDKVLDLVQEQGSGVKEVKEVEVWDVGDPNKAITSEGYNKLLDKATSLPSVKVVRPLEKTHLPAVSAGHPDPFTLDRFPSVKFSLLYSNSALVNKELHQVECRDA